MSMFDVARYLSYSFIDHAKVDAHFSIRGVHSELGLSGLIGWGKMKF